MDIYGNGLKNLKYEHSKLLYLTSTFHFCCKSKLLAQNFIFNKITHPLSRLTWNFLHYLDYKLTVPFDRLIYLLDFFLLIFVRYNFFLQLYFFSQKFPYVSAYSQWT
jgi:hypothetical protein